ncbi:MULTISPECIES: sugar isomerase [Bacteroides]|uniref:Sugar isomerase n=1 Tax=Bacteroides acidifaciens TaxID=85831 RepID=A0A4S2B288_9BACE|nr:sugar isomerase [Bacteroides acidifaciens]TGY08146.1 sugar isomerase [Bacteroides acidifaciens]
MNNKQKSKQILIFGIISQVVTLLLGILLPKLLIGGFGSEVNGLLSSVKQIFVYVALLEAGVGTAALQAMYAPIAINDTLKASEIMAATNRYFRRTGFLYGLAVLVLAFAYPYIFKVELAPLTVAAIILLQGFAGVIRYFFQGKLVILLRVDGRSYVTTNIQTAVTITSYIAQILLIVLGFDIIAVQIAYFLTNLCQMIYITWYVKKQYPWLNLSAKPDYKALGQSKFVIVHQLSGLVFNNTDMIVLTYFCGLKTVSVYALYNLIFCSVGNIIDTLCSCVEFVMGQAFNSDRKRFMRLQEAYETYYLGFSFALFTIALIMIPSFMEIYAGEFTDANYTDEYLPYLFVAVNVLMYARRTSSQIINFAGAFKQTQWRSIIESVINLMVSLIMVQYIGIYGVLVGTIAALLYRTNDVIIYANWNILHRLPWQTYKRWGINLVWMVLLVYLAQWFLPEIDSFIEWCLVSAVVAIVTVVSFLVTDTLFDFKSLIVLREFIRK